MALNYASNQAGGVNDVKALTNGAGCGAMVYVDAVQYASHRLIDVSLNYDLSARPTNSGPHLGVVYGSGAFKVALRTEAPLCQELPFRFSLGTPAFELIAGLMGTLDYFQWLGEVGVSDRRNCLRCVRGDG